MRRINLGLAVVIMGCSGQSLDVGSDPGRGGSGPSTGGGAGYLAAAGRGSPDGVPAAGRGGSSGTDFGPASGGAAVGVGGGAGSGQPDDGGAVDAAGGTDSTPRTGGGGSGGYATGGTGGLPSTGIEPTWPEPDGCTSDTAGDALVGTWEGALEDFYLQPIVSAHLVINGASERGICGTFTWGDGPPLATPTDPSAPYPSLEFWESGSKVPGFEGYPYTLQQGAAQSGLIRFSLDTLEGYQPWCPIQDVFAVDGGYACMPSPIWSADGEACKVELADGSTQTFSVYQCTCSTLCDCNENGCFARQGEPYRYELSVADGGDTLLGPAPERLGNPDYRLHFRRVR